MSKSEDLVNGTIYGTLTELYLVHSQKKTTKMQNWGKKTQETNLYKWHFKTKTAYTEKKMEILQNLTLIIWVVRIYINLFAPPFLSHKFAVRIYEHF